MDCRAHSHTAFKHRVSRAILLFFAFGLTACGGDGGDNDGGGSQVSNPAPPTVTLSVSQSSINAGEAISLSWSSTNATSCSASGGWTGNRATSGTETISESTETTSFTLACSGPGGSVSSTVTVQVASSPTPALSTLTVLAFSLDGTALDFVGEPVAGAYVRVDGELAGQTNVDGMLTVQVPPGTLTVSAVVPSFSQAQATITLAPNAVDQLHLVLDDSKEVVEQTQVRLQEAMNDILPGDFETFTVDFLRGETAVILVGLDLVELLDSDGNFTMALDEYFVLSSTGAAVASNLDAIRSLLASQTGEISVRVQGTDELGFTHAGTVRFRMGRYQLVGFFVPSPSNPELGVSGLEVRIDFLGTGIVVERLSDPDGRFEVSSAPTGNVAFDSEAFENDTYFYGQGTIFLESDQIISVVMRSVTDVVDGVPPTIPGAPPGINVSSLGMTESVPQQRRQASYDTILARELAEYEIQSSSQNLPESLQLSMASTSNSASVYVVAEDENVPVSQTAELTVPQGTTKVILEYEVFTDEYPEYVLEQSIFNDVWSVAVYGGSSGQQLLSIERNVNSQLSVSPVWQSDGRTGKIRAELDVASLAMNQSTTVTLHASATNIGDDDLETSVSASVGIMVEECGSLTIDAVQPDVVSPTKGDSSFYSISRPGQSNVFERWFTLKITKPNTATISNVIAQVRGISAPQTIVDAGPGPDVQVIDDRTLRVRVTYQSLTSNVSSTPPTTSSLTYGFAVTAECAGSMLTNEKESGPRRALWVMPNGVPRYGFRDIGRDDWVSRGTYSWITGNLALLTRVDDVSGEHARNIGHNTHERGTDLDIFHFYTFPGGAVSGGTNYNKLTDNVFAALNGDETARAQVSAWVTQTRIGLGNLLARPEVARLYYAIGSPTQRQVAPGVTISLPGGWARSLIRSGALSATSGQSLNLELGTWAFATTDRVAYNSVHNSHIHIALNSNLLQN